jgi:hypothetical protein
VVWLVIILILLLTIFVIALDSALVKPIASLSAGDLAGFCFTEAESVLKVSSILLDKGLQLKKSNARKTKLINFII